MNNILNENSFFDQKMYFSSRAFTAPISTTHWVLFSPDHVGAPIVITNYVYYLLKSFKHGGFVDDIFRSAFVMGAYTHEQIFYCINALINRGFLVKEMQNKRYSAHDSTPINNIGTIEVWLHITNYCNLQCSTVL